MALPTNFSKPAGTQREVGLHKKVVLALTEKIQHKHHHVFIDNYFNSVELIEKLLERNLFGCGTVRSNLKDLPQQMKPAVQKRKADNENQPRQPQLKLPPGQCKQWQNGKILAAIWGWYYNAIRDPRKLRSTSEKY